MKWSARREKFRAILEGAACVYPASVHDPVSARIAEDLGFELGMFAGSTASLAVLGAPDVLTVTLTEFAEQAHRICRAGGLPLLVDADHGYGNALNVRRTVEELEDAGVAGLTIEDTLLPVPFGADPAASQLISVQEGLGKMRAALSSRYDPRLAVVGRTSALAIAGLGEAVTRVRAYTDAGVDAIFLVGVRTPDELAELRSATPLPLILGNVEPAMMNASSLADAGVRICLQGHLPFSAAISALYETLKALREGVMPSEVRNLSPDDLLKRVTRNEEYAGWTKAFLRPDGDGVVPRQAQASGAQQLRASVR
jgi:carboxyvinyl-carboxyphosphonate phosphorylmutase